MVTINALRAPKSLISASALALGLAISLGAAPVAQAAKPKEVTSDLSVNPGLAERQLERKKQEWRDVKTEQKRVIDEFLKCVEASKYLSDVTSCERAEKEEAAKIRRAVKGLETIKR
jgi:hypothetical protein